MMGKGVVWGSRAAMTPVQGRNFSNGLSGMMRPFR